MIKKTLRVRSLWCWSGRRRVPPHGFRQFSVHICCTVPATVQSAKDTHCLGYKAFQNISVLQRRTVHIGLHTLICTRIFNSQSCLDVSVPYSPCVSSRLSSKLSRLGIFRPPLDSSVVTAAAPAIGPPAMETGQCGFRLESVAGSLLVSTYVMD